MNKTKKIVTKINSKISFFESNQFKIVIFLILIGLVLRFYRIGYLSLWVDEYMHGVAAAKGLFKHSENNGIFLTWMDTIFVKIFGQSEFVLRLPVALFGIFTIYIVFLIGKKIKDYKLGLFSAILVTFSLFLIYWCRVVRPYGMVPFFYAVLIYSCLNVFKEEKVDYKWIAFTFLFFILAMLNQLISFLFIFSAGFYGSFLAIESWINKKSKPYHFNFYNLLCLLTLLAILLMFTPLSNTLMRPIIELFLPPNIASLILPNMKVVSKAFSSENWLSSYDKYINVITYDFKYLYLFGILGLIVSFFKDRKIFYFIASFFIVPLFLMSFIFREPAHAKYLTFIYPVFIIAIAYGFYFFIYKLVNEKIFKNAANTNKNINLSFLIFLLLIFVSFQSKDLKKMLTSKEHGNVVPNEISEIHFVNWKQPCMFIKDKMKKGDVLMATIQQAPKFYLQTDSVVWFRQMHLNPKWNLTSSEQKYVPNDFDKNPKSAYTYENLVKTFNENKRGWLLADYYFENALTDPRAKQFVEQNFNFHFEACDDGAVKVFSWDKEKPKTYQSSFVHELGKNIQQLATPEMSINMTLSGQQKYLIGILSQGIDSENEAIIAINGQQFAIKPNSNPDKLDYNTIEVSANMFKNGPNTIQFGYNNEVEDDNTKGFVILDLRVQ